MLLTNVRTAKLAGAQKFPVSISTGLLGAIVPDRPMAFKQVSFIVGSGRKRKPWEAQDRRGKLEGDIRPFGRVTSSLSVEIARGLGGKTCKQGAFIWHCCEQIRGGKLVPP